MARSYADRNYHLKKSLVCVEQGEPTRYAKLQRARQDGLSKYFYSIQQRVRQELSTALGKVRISAPAAPMRYSKQLDDKIVERATRNIACGKHESFSEILAAMGQYLGPEPYAKPTPDIIQDWVVRQANSNAARGMYQSYDELQRYSRQLGENVNSIHDSTPSGGGSVASRIARSFARAGT